MNTLNQINNEYIIIIMNLLQCLGVTNGAETKIEEVGRKNYIQLDTFSVDDHVSIYAIF